MRRRRNKGGAFHPPLSTALTPFTFEGAAVRVVTREGEPWFVAKDAAEILGYGDPTTAIKSHCRGVQILHPILDALGRSQNVRIIAEPDLLRLIIGSRLPAAEKFERWVFEEVLPAIRKTGGYQVGQMEASQTGGHVQNNAIDRVPLKNRTTDELVALIDAGKFVAEIAREWGVDQGNLTRWIQADADRLERSRDARREQAAHWDLQAEAVLLALHRGSNEAEVVRARELASHYRWRASKFSPREYGDRIKVEVTGTVAVRTARELTDRELRIIAAGGVLPDDGGGVEMLDGFDPAYIVPRA